MSCSPHALQDDLSRRTITLFLAVALTVATIRATTIDWSNTGTDWATGTNWSTGVAPASSTTTDLAQFGAGSAVNPNLGANRSVAGIIFASGASAYAVGGSTLTIGASGIVNNATVAETFSNSVQISASQSWTTVAGGTLVLAGITDLNASSSTSRTLTIAGAGNTTFNGTVQNSSAGSTGVMTFSGTGALTLGGTNTFNGGLTVSGGGTLKLGHASALGTGSLTISSSGVTLDNASGSALTLATNNVQAWNGNITFTGTNNLNLGAGAVTMSASRTITASASTLTIGGGIDLNSTSTAARTLTINGGGTVVLNGAIRNSFAGSTGNVVYSGTGALTLAAANAHTGTTTLNSGTLNLNHAAALGAGGFTIAGGTINNTSGAAITNSNNNPQNWNGDFTFTGTNDLNLGNGAVALGASRTVTISAGTLTVDGIVSGASRSVTKTGSGTLSFGGTNTYTGGTNINGGTLALTNSQALGPSGTIMFGGGTLQHSAGNTTDYSARIASSGSAIAIDTNGQSVTYATALPGSNTGGLSKSGSGTLTLTGANAYSGGTTISAGTLSVTGAGTIGSGAATISGGALSVGAGITIPNAISVGAAGQLAGTGSAAFSGRISGTGSLSGTLTLASGGSIAPGNSPGILSVASGSTLTFSSGSTYAWELGRLVANDSGTAGTNWDLITLLGTGSSLLTNQTFLVPSFLSANSAPNQGDAFWTSTHSWTVVAGNANTITGTFQVDNSAWSGGTFSTSLSGGDLVLNWTASASAIPEPSTYAAIIGAIALAGAAWRRHRARQAGVARDV